jgi:hypothetical protein
MKTLEHWYQRLLERRLGMNIEGGGCSAAGGAAGLIEV